MNTASRREVAGDASWPRISIVTPCYNAEAHIEATMCSVLEQGYPNLEYIVVDGGSTDGTVGLIQKYEDQLAAWTSEPDDGMYYALQKGLAHSTGEVMGWINADDLHHRNSLFSIGEIFATFPEVEWIHGCPTCVDGQGRPMLGHMMRGSVTLPRWSKYDYYRGEYRWIQQESTVWRRSLWERAGGSIDTNYQYAADLELWARFFRHARLYPVESLIGAFRKWSGAQISSAQFDEYVAEAEQIVRRERERMTAAERRTLRRLQWGKQLRQILGRTRVLNAWGLWRQLRDTLLDLPPVIRYDTDTEEFFY